MITSKNILLFTLFGAMVALASCKGGNSEKRAALQVDSTAPAVVKAATLPLLDDPDNPELLYKRASAWLLSQKPEPALKDIDLAIALKKTTRYIIIPAAPSISTWLKMRPAIEDFNTAIKLKPDYEDAYLKLGETYLYVFDFDASLYNLNKVLELNRNNATAFFLPWPWIIKA